MFNFKRVSEDNLKINKKVSIAMEILVKDYMDELKLCRSGSIHKSAIKH